MMEIFKQLTLSEFEEKFGTEEACLAFLSAEKWKAGFQCRKCGARSFFQGKTPFSRRCSHCKHIESATSHTLFHHCHLPLPEAFRMAYTICHEPGISSYSLSRQLNRRQMTCWKFLRKVEACQRKEAAEHQPE